MRTPVPVLLAAFITTTAGFIFVRREESSPVSSGQPRTAVSGEQLVRGAGSSEPTTPDTPTVRELDDGRSGQPSFEISGRVSGFYPGASIALVLTLSNPNSFAISVTSLEVDVRSPGSGCGPANLEVGPFYGPVAVPGKDSAITEISVRMVENPDDACQGVTFPLVYRGAAVPT